jgi:hypothetical protein
MGPDESEPRAYKNQWDLINNNIFQKRKS